MPIQGLTTQPGRLPEIGQLRKGAPKTTNAPGADLGHFRFTSEDYPVLVGRFAEKFGNEPRSIGPIYLVNKTVNENLSAWQEEWVAGGLVHRCDGSGYCTLWRLPDGRYAQAGPAQMGAVQKPCPGGCKPVGRLSVLVPALGHLATVCVLTTSINDIKHLHEQLTAIEMLQGSLQGIPLVLRRAPHKISVPGKDGKRARMAKSLLSIEAMPQWFELKLAEIEAGARPNVPQLGAGQAAPEASAPDPEDDTEDAEWSDPDEAPAEQASGASIMENASGLPVADPAIKGATSGTPATTAPEPARTPPPTETRAQPRSTVAAIVDPPHDTEAAESASKGPVPQSWWASWDKKLDDAEAQDVDVKGYRLATAEREGFAREVLQALVADLTAQLALKKALEESIP